MVDPEAPVEEPALSGHRRSVRVRAKRTREEAARQLNQLREEHEIVEAVLEASEHDRRRAGSLLAGGIAFRIFLWLLPAALVLAGIIGLVRPSGSAQPDHVARSLGLGASVAVIIRQATKESHKGTEALLAIGIVLTLYMSVSLVRALRVAHVLAWEESFGRRRHLLRDGTLVSVALLTLLVCETGIAYLRHRVGPGVSLLLSLVPIAISGAIWVAISWLLPHQDAPWPALIPGAALLAVGIAVLHFATVFYFAPKLTKAPALYGSLGTAATLLVWLFVGARMIVASAFLNATLWRRNTVVLRSSL